jgi:hypothetical protein
VSPRRGPWGDLIGIAAATWFLLSGAFADLPSKRLLDAVAFGILAFSVVGLIRWWRTR